METHKLMENVFDQINQGFMVDMDEYREGLVSIKNNYKQEDLMFYVGYVSMVEGGMSLLTDIQIPNFKPMKDSRVDVMMERFNNLKPERQGAFVECFNTLLDAQIDNTMGFDTLDDYVVSGFNQIELDAMGEQISKVGNQTRAEMGSVNALRLDEDMLSGLSDNGLEL